MKKRILILADLGRLRAYLLEEPAEGGRPRIRLIEERETAVTHHLVDDVTDQVGRFRKEPAIVGARSDGEEHNLNLQRRRQALKQLADVMIELIHREEYDGCYFAADARINQAILDELDPAARAKIQKNVAANLTKLGAEELRDRFTEEGVTQEGERYAQIPRQA